MDYAETIGAIYLETSAKEDMNVQEIFTKLSKFANRYQEITSLAHIQ